MEKPDRSGSIILGGLALLFGLGGLILLAVGTSIWLKGEATRTWNTVPGEILESKMVEVDGSTGVYTVEIRYRYLVNGSPHDGNRITLDDYSTTNLGEMYHLAEKFPAGSTVLVYVDPSQVDSALLIPGPGRFTWIWFLIGSGFLLPGLILGFFWIKLVRAEQQEAGKTHRHLKSGS
jgi:hypothetical protein